MNGRLKEIMTEAGFDPEAIERMGVMPQAEKFGLLLIAECIAQCETVATDARAMTKSVYVTDSGRMLHEGMWGGAKNSIGAIMRNFGITDQTQ